MWFINSIISRIWFEKRKFFSLKIGKKEPTPFAAEFFLDTTKVKLFF